MTASFTSLGPDIDPHHTPASPRPQPAHRLVRETSLTVNDLIGPIFVIACENRREPIVAMPGIERRSADLAAREAERRLPA